MPKDTVKRRFGARVSSVFVRIQQRTRDKNETHSFVVSGEELDDVARIVEDALSRAYGQADADEEEEETVPPAQPIRKKRRA